MTIRQYAKSVGFKIVGKLRRISSSTSPRHTVPTAWSVCFTSARIATQRAKRVARETS